MIYNMGSRLEKLRKRQHLTQKAVAERLGVTRATISGYEHEVAQPPADILIKLASIYRCTTDFILGMTKQNDSDTVIHMDRFSPEQQEKLIQIVAMIGEVADLSGKEDAK